MPRTNDRSLDSTLRFADTITLTSACKGNWKEQVKHVLTLLHQMWGIPLLYSLFQTASGKYKLNVFWRSSPPKKLLRRLEEVLWDTIRVRPGFQNTRTIEISHTVVNSHGKLSSLKGDGLSTAIKSKILDEPRPDGMVGIGVYLDSNDLLKTSALKDILTAILNLIGSLSSHGKYTDDLEYYATKDPLTNLFNQRIFWELLECQVARAKRYKTLFSLLVLDNDNFKSINDTYGHGFGDTFLRGYAYTLRSCARRDDILARYGGDEFVAILPDTSLDEAQLIAQRMVEAVNNFSLATKPNETANSTVSIGLATFPQHATTAKDLFTVADNMLYRSKADGKNRVSFPGQEFRSCPHCQSGDKHLQVLQALEDMLVVPHFQPIVDTTSGKIKAYEVLMRLDLSTKTLAAGEFIGIAQKIGLMGKLDQVMLEKALILLRESGFQGQLFLNLSPKAISTEDFIATALTLTRANSVKPQQIVFEVPETELTPNRYLLDELVPALKAQGFKFAIDKYGADFSAKSGLEKYAADFIKLDGAFLKGMAEDSREIGQSIAMATAKIGTKTIGEFVETEAILGAVRMAGINYAQGYHTGRPAPEMLA